MQPYLLFALFFQTSSEPVTLLRSCGEPAHISRNIQAADVVRVRSAIAGGLETCYAVTATVDGKSMDGYIQGDKLSVIIDFERQRREVVQPVAEAPPAAKPTLREEPHRRAFGDFSAVDVKGKAVRLRELRGRVVVICFWSPSSQTSIRELLAVSRSFFELHKKGLDVIAVSLSASRDDIEDAFEGAMAFPDIPDRYGIAARHGISHAAVPYTFVLDQHHEIVAAGLHGAALEDAIRETLKGE